MTYNEAMEFIEESGRYGSVLGLDSMKALLGELNNPQDKLQFVHVAGTNGKGSTAACIATIAAVSGCRVGRYISPAVFEYREIIEITERNPGEETAPVITEYISEEAIASCISRIKPACEHLTGKGQPHPTVFEIETAMAMLYFLEKACDIVVLEVGLGGKLDATNVVTTVLCSVITSISKDHMGILGNTLEEIAAQKAGIIKEGVPVVSYEQEEEAARVIEAVCAGKHAVLVTADFHKIQIKKQNMEETLFSYDGRGDYRIRLLGENQVKNAVVALLAIEVLRGKGFPIKETDIKMGLYHTKWRGRFDIIRRNPILLADGAHNEDGARSLAKNIEFYFQHKKIIYILGVLADKDYDAILKHTAAFAHRIITVTPKNLRGLSSQSLAKTAEKYCSRVTDAAEVPAAVDLALKEAREEDVILAFGSFSYLREVYQYAGQMQ